MDSHRILLTRLQGNRAQITVSKKKKLKKIMAIANNSLLQHLKVNTLVPTEGTQGTKIKLAIAAMLWIQANEGCKHEKAEERSSPHSFRKRPKTASDSSPVAKRQCISLSDEILDRVADEVSEVSEWEIILANWNPDQENLLFGVLDSSLVESL